MKLHEVLGGVMAAAVCGFAATAQAINGWWKVGDGSLSDFSKWEFNGDVTQWSDLNLVSFEHYNNPCTVTLDGDASVVQMTFDNDDDITFDFDVWTFNVTQSSGDWGCYLNGISNAKVTLASGTLALAGQLTLGVCEKNDAISNVVCVSGGELKAKRISIGKNATEYSNEGNSFFVDGGSVEVSGETWLGDGGEHVVGERLRVSNGGRMVSKYLRVGGIDGEVTLDNGTLSLTSSGSFTSSYETTGSKGLKMNFSGEAPQFTASGVELSANAALKFTVPAAGWADAPIVTTGSVKFKDDTVTLAVDVDAFSERGGTVPLIRSSGGTVTMDGGSGTMADQIAVWNAGLPEGCELVLSEDAKTLSLKVVSLRPRFGTSIRLR